MLAFRNLALGGLLLLGCVATEAGEAWPEFRGPFGDGHVQAPGDTNVSRMRVGRRLPLRAAAVHGVAVARATMLSEAARVCRLAARVVLYDNDGAPPQLAEHGLRVLAQQGSTTVAVREH